MSEDTPWLTPDELAAWVHLTGVLMTLPPVIDAQLKRDASINFFEYSILVGLSHPPGRAVPLCSLVLLAHGSPSRLSHALSRLEKQGWIQRRGVDGDPRSVEALLTDAGYAKLVATAPNHAREVRQRVIDVLPPEDLAQFSVLCRRLLASLSPESLIPIDQALLDGPAATGGKAPGC
ncbi:MAG: MarR family winged helix-turn-helix transcriptional regulator [Actinoplanes sp.]